VSSIQVKLVVWDITLETFPVPDENNGEEKANETLNKK
jgi:hypothetical protein